ncbi:MAG: TonB-dependent receptor [Pseudomonadota bacterium]
MNSRTDPCRRITACLSVLVCALPATGFAQSSNSDDENAEIEEITVIDRRVANTRPAGTFAATATALRFDPATELQSRGLAEGQADVVVRGSSFENTGFKVGAVTIIDPQTGHYAAELPFDPALLSSPDIRTGVDNSLGGFNSNVATVTYSIPTVVPGGNVLLGVGSDDLNYQSARWATIGSREEGVDYGLQLSAARSEGDGSIDNGDHEFKRFNVQLQHSDSDSQSDFILAYQDKFYGWPGAYTGFATLPETDHTKTLLALGNHRQDRADGWWEASVFYRELDDDYDFDRTTQESGEPGSFDHETRVYGLGLHGLRNDGDWDWRYAAQFTADDLVRSTDLTEGSFSSRNYLSLSVVPEITVGDDEGRQVTFRVGATADVSSEDENSVLPVLGIRVTRNKGGDNQYVSLDYAGTSQVPGYTVLNSRPAGLFGGNPDLGRERADEFSLTLGQESSDWYTNFTAFYRKDDDLVDWTFSSGAPFARQANAVDLDVFGAQLVYGRSWRNVDLVAGYSYLDKDEDYIVDTVDASFYALNFARHRATLALRFRLSDRLELLLDNEYRQQEANPLRASSDNAFISSAAIAWNPQNGRGLGVALAIDNIGDDDFEQFPGTPAVGQQLSLSARYDW